MLVFTNFVFKLQNFLILSLSKCKSVYLLIDTNGIFMLRIVQIRAVPSCKRVDLLMLRNSVFKVLNVEIWAVLSSNEFDLLMLRLTNRVFRLQIVKNCAVPSRNCVSMLMLMYPVFMLRSVQIWAMSS